MIAGAFWAVWAAAGAAAAPAADPPLRLTLAEAVARGLAASAAVAQARAGEDAAQAEARLARSGRLPQLELQAGYTRLSDVPELTIASPGTPPRTIFPNIPDNYRVRAALALPLYTGGRTERLLEAARAEERAAGSQVEASAADAVLETTAAYWALVTAREAEQVAAEARQARERHLADARNREQFGLAAGHEVLAAEVERDRAGLAVLRARHAAEVAQASLARLLALPPGTSVEPAEPPAPLAGEVPELEGLVARAQAARPERAALLGRIEAAQARVRAERAARLPQVALAAGYDYANPNRRILPPEARFQDSWDVSLNVSWALFDGGRASASEARAQARVVALRSQLADLDGRLRLQVAQRRLELEAARAAAAVAERAVQAARAAAEAAADAHREGLLDAAGVLDAQVALARARLEHTESLAQARLAAAALERAVGE